MQWAVKYFIFNTEKSNKQTDKGCARTKKKTNFASRPQVAKHGIAPDKTVTSTSIESVVTGMKLAGNTLHQ